MIRKIIVSLTAGLFLLAGCSGQDPESTPQHVDMVRHSWQADGTETTTVEDVVVNLPITTPGEAQDVVADDETEYGQTVEAISVSTNYGTLSGTGASADSRCPSTWSAPNYCAIPATKLQSIFSILASDHGVDNTTVQAQVGAAISYFGNVYIEGSPREFRTSASGSATLLIRASTPGDCGQTDLACTVYYTSSQSQFNIGGKPYRKHLLLANPHGDVVYTTMYVNSPALVAHATSGAPSSLPPAQKQIAINNYLKNSILHEWGHAMGHGHNPSSPIMTAGGSVSFYAADAEYTVAETSQRINFSP